VVAFGKLVGRGLEDGIERTDETLDFIFLRLRRGHGVGIVIGFVDLLAGELLFPAGHGLGLGDDFRRDILEGIKPPEHEKKAQQREK